jgi:hypothetical protein
MSYLVKRNRISANEWAKVPSALKSGAFGFRFGSGRVASRRADGVQDSQRLEPEAESSACAVILFFQFGLKSIHTNAKKGLCQALFYRIERKIFS